MKSNLHTIFLLLVLILGCNKNADENRSMAIDGKIYQVRDYNGVTWMTENLKTTKDINDQEVVHYFPNGDKHNEETYGLLYNYETACRICPSGWKLPSDQDWEQLFELQQNTSSAYKDTQYWANETNSNSTGFSARPAGVGNSGEFDNAFASKAYFWAISKQADHPWSFILEHSAEHVRKAQQHPIYALSVRCIKVTTHNR